MRGCVGDGFIVRTIRNLDVEELNVSRVVCREGRSDRREDIRADMSSIVFVRRVKNSRRRKALVFGITRSKELSHVLSQSRHSRVMQWKVASF